MICVSYIVYAGKFCVTLSTSLRLFICFQALQSDIELRKKNVDQAISNGMELLKQTTGMSNFMTFLLVHTAESLPSVLSL